MYGNTSFGTDAEEIALTQDQRRTIRRDLASVSDRTRDLLPGEFVVGSELTEGSAGPRATVQVQPPIGSVVSANYDLDGDDVGIAEDERDELARGLAASAALQVKQVLGDADEAAVAR